MISFYKMPEKEMILLSAAIAVFLTENLTADEQNTLGNFLLSVGQDIILGANQITIRESGGNDQSQNNNKICGKNNNKIKNADDSKNIENKGR